MRSARRNLLVIFFAVTIFLSIIPIFTHMVFATALNSQESLIRRNDAGLVLLDYKNRPFFSFYSARLKKEVPISSIPKWTKQAIIASEDKNFYSHPGFSLLAIARSIFKNIESNSLSYGGSTITQQLVKNSLLSSRKDFLRKYQEIILASEIERKYSKDQILEMYLNSTYFGEGSFGIEAAANTYFNKAAQDLTLAQSAALAAILPSPSRLSLLYGDFDEAKNRQKLILEKMVQQGFITNKQKDQALEEDLAIVPHLTDINNIAPHFALMVRDELIEQYGEETIARSGFKVKTTLDLDWQKYAEKTVAQQVDRLKPNRVSNGAAVALDPATSEIRVMVGSTDWYDEQFGKVNLALAPRPPGSAFKPIVYVKALEQGIITPATLLHDQQTRFANFNEDKYYASFPTRAAALSALSRDPQAFYSPKNYDGKFRGPVTVRKALANSLNVPAVEVMKKVGIENALDSAKNLGITTLKDPSNYGLSLVLGAGEVKLLELTNVYAVFANQGLKNEPAAILEIIDKNGHPIYQYQSNPQPVIAKEYAFLISSILSDNKARNDVFGTVLNISRPAAVKTGTTENYKDSWTLGYTPSLAIGVWVGNNFGEPMDGIAGSLGAAPIWKDLMEKFLAGTEVQQFEPPEGIVTASSNCSFDLSTRIASYSAIPEYFVRGTEPVKSCKK